MTRTAAVMASEVEQLREGLPVIHANRTEPLRECVRGAMRFYLHSMDGHEVTGLHRMVMSEVEKPLIETVLVHAKGNQSKAASMLGMSRSTLRKKIKEFDINPSAQAPKA